MSITENKNIPSDKEFISSFEIYKDKFNMLIDFGEMDYDMRKGCKLGHSGGNLYISHNTIYQSVHRWWYVEGREDLYSYLDDEFNNYAIFLKEVNIVAQEVPYHMWIKELISYNIKFINGIKSGLDKIKYIYSNYPALDTKVNSIIATLDEFLVKHREIIVINSV
jgi:hypothetical protein